MLEIILTNLFKNNLIIGFMIILIFNVLFLAVKYTIISECKGKSYRVFIPVLGEIEMYKASNSSVFKYIFLTLFPFIFTTSKMYNSNFLFVFVLIYLLIRMKVLYKRNYNIFKRIYNFDSIINYKSISKYSFFSLIDHKLVFIIFLYRNSIETKVNKKRKKVKYFALFLAFIINFTVIFTESVNAASLNVTNYLKNAKIYNQELLMASNENEMIDSIKKERKVLIKLGINDRKKDNNMYFDVYDHNGQPFYGEMSVNDRINLNAEDYCKNNHRIVTYYSYQGEFLSHYAVCFDCSFQRITAVQDVIEGKKIISSKKLKAAFDEVENENISNQEEVKPEKVEKPKNDIVNKKKDGIIGSINEGVKKIIDNPEEVIALFTNLSFAIAFETVLAMTGLSWISDCIDIAMLIKAVINDPTILTMNGIISVGNIIGVSLMIISTGALLSVLPNNFKSVIKKFSDKIYTTSKKAIDKFVKKIFKDKLYDLNLNITKAINKIRKPYKHYPKKSINDLPQNVQIAFKGYSSNNWMGQYRGQVVNGYSVDAGRHWKNDYLQMPETNNSGQKIKYFEYDVNTRKKGDNRDAERFVVSEDGTVYYTDSHYKTYIEIKERVRNDKKQNS